jgi:hypothetical protein
MPSKSYKACRERKFALKFAMLSLISTETIRDAVARIWPLFRKAPPPFVGYKTAERYLAQRLACQQFDYGVDPEASDEFYGMVKGRVHHVFAREAASAGLFVIDSVPPPPKGLPSSAVPESMTYNGPNVQPTQEAQVYVRPAHISGTYPQWVCSTY